MHERYYVELAKQEKLLSRKNEKSDFYNGVFDRYVNPVLTRDMIPLTWRYDLNEETNPFFMERLGINAVMNSGAIYLNGKYYLVARIEGNDRKSFFGVAESDNGIDNFRFWDYPILLDDVCPEETNVYDMRLTQHEDGYIYGVFCSESKEMSCCIRNLWMESMHSIPVRWMTSLIPEAEAVLDSVFARTSHMQSLTKRR